MIEAEFLVLGGGPCGLAAGSELGDRAIVIERDARPGGLMKTECFDGYWFDRVLHLLHLAEPEVLRRVQALVGGVMAHCPPSASVVCDAGTARFPLQLHLRGLDAATRVSALLDLHRATFGPPAADATDYRELLRRAFGATLCEQFFFPYNAKMWKRPLEELSNEGFVWNIHRPSFEEALRGAIGPAAEEPATYNSNGWYPRPPADAPIRGMEVLSRALAARAPRLELGCEVVSIDLDARMVTAIHGDEERRYRWTGGCLSSLPLPRVVAMSHGRGATPDNVAKLSHTNVASVAFRLRGPRPEAADAWTYYADPDLPFTRLIRPHAFDPLCAPADGWGLMAEVIWRADQPPPSPHDLVATCRAGIERAGAVPPSCEVLGAHLMEADPAYVVFGSGVVSAVARCRERLAAAGVDSLGRYGGWQYSSIEAALLEGWGWAEQHGSARGGRSAGG